MVVQLEYVKFDAKAGIEVLGLKVVGMATVFTRASSFATIFWWPVVYSKEVSNWLGKSSCLA